MMITYTYADMNGVGRKLFGGNLFSSLVINISPRGIVASRTA